MKVLLSDYAFTPGGANAGTITVPGDYTLEQFLLVTNVSTGTVIYQFNAPAKGGTVSSSSGSTTLTLEFSTAGMSSGHSLQVFVDAGTGSSARTVLNGPGAPSSGTGVDGDFYIDTTATSIYGPKAAGAWGSETSLVGPAGPTGEPGPAGPGATLSNATPQPLGTAAAGTSSNASRADHVHASPDLSGYATTGDIAALQARLDGFRDARTFYVSKGGNNSNNGTSPGEAFLTIGAAVTAANAYVTANSGATAKISVGPGRFVEASLPFRLKPNILAQGALQRGTIIEPASGQELNGFWALDSGCMVCDFRFAGHQASGTSSTDSTVGTRAWAVRFNELANSGQGVILTASPYVKDCASITAEDDAGLAGSTSTGDTGGGVLVDGAMCHPDSPVRSMLVYGFTQQNLGGPGAVVRNDAYAELVSFFGLFGTWHVQCETGGQATMSGGGCSEFGTYGLVADGYSSTALFTGTLGSAASAGALTVDVVSMTANRLGSSSRPASGQIMLLGGTAYVVQSSTPITGGYRVTFYNPGGTGLAGNVAQGATADFRQRSQISAGCHSANYVGSGTNYNALPWNGGVPVRGNEAVERNLGRVFGLLVNDIGDVKVAGGAFAVDGTTGSVTINTSQFNLSGLNAIGPFSRNGGVSTVGVQLQEVSNNTSLLASTGSADSNTAPTQYAVTQYLQTYYAPLSDARLSDSREWLADTVSQAEAEAGTATTRRAWTALRVFQATAAWWAGSTAATKLAGVATGATANATDAQLRDRSTHTGTQSATTITGLATVATTGAYSDLSGKPTLGTAAALDTGTSSGNVVVLGTGGKLPAVDGSLLTGLPASGLTSVGLVAPTGFSVSGSPLTSNGSITLSFATGYSLPTTASQGNWDTAYTDRLKWDGGATGLDATTARSSLGLGTLATQSGTFSGTSSGTNTGDQTITLTGDVTGSGTGSFAATLANTAVTAGSYTYGSFTVDAKGRLTAASSGTAPVTSVSGTAPIISSGGTTPAISISAATTSAAGSMSAADKTKLDGVASGATANSSDATLLARANHTGTQAGSTVTGAYTAAGMTMATAKVLGRSTSGTGAAEELSLAAGLNLVSGTLYMEPWFGFACSDETTAITTGTSKLRFRMPFACTLLAVVFEANTAPTGSAAIFDLNEGGVSVFSTNPRIDASGTDSSASGTPAVISDSSIAAGAVMTVDFDQIGSTVAGKGIKMWINVRRTA